MVRKTIWALTIALCTLEAHAASPLYPVSDIPDSMKTNAYAVVREQKTIFYYNGIGQGVQYNYLALTVLNKNGDQSAGFDVPYDKFSHISDIAIVIYDADGKRIKRAKTDDIIDYSPNQQLTLFADLRVIHYQPEQNNYPYTITMEYNETQKGILGLPTWMPQTDNNISVQESVFKIVAKDTIHFRHKEYNCPGPAIVELSGKTEYTWTARNIQAFDNEPYMPDHYSFLPTVVVAPNAFELDGHTGNMQSWESYSKWISDLNNQPNTLSQKTKDEVKALTANLTTNYEKVKAVYKYMQDRTRYISIQVGIGGWKPFDASVTDKYNYGDCKALSNYMKALLNEIGINTLYMCINSSEYEPAAKYDMPRNVFNHAKLAVPMDNDTLMLECTSQHCPFGYDAKSTTNRPTLIVAPEGGKLIFIHAPSAADNLQARNVKVTFDNTGQAKLVAQTRYKGLLYEHILISAYLDNEKQKKWLYETIDVPNLKITSFSFVPDNQPKPVGTENIEATLNEYLTVTGKRVFLPLNMFNRSSDVPSTSKPRRFNFGLYDEYTHVDTIEYNLPEGLKIENAPANITIESKFGSYTSKINAQERNKIVYIRSLQMHAGQFDKDEFAAFANFKKQIAKADNAKVSLLRNGS